MTGVPTRLPRGEGTLDVYIVGEAGPPEPALVAAVQAVVDQNRPITADALVLAPSPVEVPVSLTLVPRAGYDTTAMDAEIRRRLSIYFGDITDPALVLLQLGVGKDVVVSQLVALVMGVPGVYSVTVAAPAANVSIVANEFPELGAVTLVMEAPSYE